MVLNGIDRIDAYEKLFFKKRIGLITSPSGMDSHFNSTLEILHRKFGLTALYSPEHGVRGNLEAGALVDSYVDPVTQVTVFSLYRKDSKRLTPEMIEDVDIVVYDIQDVGCRYYTFIYTMLYALEDCARYGKKFIVLDRINPLDGLTVEGNVLNEDFKSFVGAYTLPMRYGLTIGEFALMANSELQLGCDLHVVPCDGWQRSMLFPELGRPWIMPSMNLPRFESALMYPGMCLFEGTNLSEGRGTTCPFEIIGAPFINSSELAKAMNDKKLPGVFMRPVYFKPIASKFSGQMCEGIQVHVTDQRLVRPVETGVELLFEIKSRYEAFEFLPPLKEGKPAFIDLLGGSRDLQKENIQIEGLIESYRSDSRLFSLRKQAYHLYA